MISPNLSIFILFSNYLTLLGASPRGLRADFHYITITKYYNILKEKTQCLLTLKKLLYLPQKPVFSARSDAEFNFCISKSKRLSFYKNKELPSIL